MNGLALPAEGDDRFHPAAQDSIRSVLDTTTSNLVEAWSLIEQIKQIVGRNQNPKANGYLADLIVKSDTKAVGSPSPSDGLSGQAFELRAQSQAIVMELQRITAWL